MKRKKKVFQKKFKKEKKNDEKFSESCRYGTIYVEACKQERNIRRSNWWHFSHLFSCIASNFMDCVFLFLQEILLSLTFHKKPKGSNSLDLYNSVKTDKQSE